MRKSPQAESVWNLFYKGYCITGYYIMRCPELNLAIDSPPNKEMW